MRRSISVLVAVLAMLVGAAASSFAAGPRWDSPEQRKDILTARQATAAYHDVTNAMEDGYVQTTGCIEGMGYHYANLDLVDDPQLDPAAPEALVYVPTDDGLELRAVEHLVRPGLASRPTAYDGVPFDDGPFGPGSYALHIWVWGAPNPDGTFNATNSDVICPGD